MTIGKTIKSRRKELGMTQEQLAKAVFVTPQAVSQWENEKSVSDVLNLGAIAHALQMNKGDLIGDEDYSKPSWLVRDQFFSPENMKSKLLEFAATDGLPQLAKAVEYAWAKHDGQFRKVGPLSKEAVPYIVHPYMMTCQAHALGIVDDTVLAACVLHDICEDCGVSPEELPFDDGVRNAVRILTKPQDKSAFDNDAYYSVIGADRTAAIVKALDRCNNISTMLLSFPVEKIIEYIGETERYVYPLLDKIKKEYVEYYDAVFVLKYQMLSVLESAKAAIIRL